MMKIKWSLFFLLLVTTCSSLTASDNSALLSLKNQRIPTALEISLWSLGIIGTYHLIKYGTQVVSSYVEDKIIDTVADSITLAFTPKGLLHRIVPTGKESEALQKKARYIVLRKAVLQKLNDILNTNTLSQEHRSIMNSLLKKLEDAFRTIDKLRFKTSHEKSYQMTWIDHYIVGRVIESIQLTTKPYHECTVNELKAKQLQKERRAKIIHKLSTNVLTTLYLLSDPVLRDLNTASWL